MTHESIKIVHILSATFVLTSMFYSYYLWRMMPKTESDTELSQCIQMQTWIIIIPFAIVQLVTGFTMISMKNEDLSQLWISGSAVGFIIAIVSWFAFIYFLLSAQHDLAGRKVFFRRIQASMLSICTLALLSMIFFMANKIV
jgi:uncharacterized membrane protein